MADAPRLLLAEDDPALAALLVCALEGEGYRVAHVRTAREAQEAAGRHRWAACLVDTFEPTATAGPSRALRDLLAHLSPRAPVLVLTAHTWATRVDAAELGVAAIVPKPFDLDELFAAVWRLVRQ